MKDFSYWDVFEGNAEGSGRSEKIWLINPDTKQIGLFKYKKDNCTTDHISECIAYYLAQLVGIPCAKYEVGMYHGREGSISYNIINDVDEILVEGISFINRIFPKYDTEKLIDVESGAEYSLEMIKKSIKEFVPFGEFLKIPIFDYLIGNTDRHQNNWAIIERGDKREMSPLYDNSSSLCAYLSESQLIKYMGNDKMLWNSLVISKSRSVIRRTMDEKKKPTHWEMMLYIKQHYYEDTVDFVKKIISVVTEENVNVILERYTDELLPDKTIIIKRFLMDKVSRLKDLYFGEVD